MEGSGQKLYGFEFYKAAYTRMFSPDKRYVYIRSVLLKDGHPQCVVDHSPRYSGNRDIVVQTCINAVQVFDGREIWLVRSQPVLTRWYNNSNMAIKDSGLAFPVISNYTPQDKTNIFENWQGRLFHSPNNDKCLSISGDLFKFNCTNQNVKAYATHIRPELEN